MNSLPPDIVQRFDGINIDAAVNSAGLEAVSLLTVNDEGWINEAHISIGELYAASPTELRLALWPNSRSNANLRKTLKATLSLIQGEDVVMIRCRVNAEIAYHPDLKLDLFRFSVLEVQITRAPYAAVTSGVRFSLKDPEQVLARWKEQIAAIKACR